jgi:hypothetical protein
VLPTEQFTQYGIHTGKLFIELQCRLGGGLRIEHRLLVPSAGETASGCAPIRSLSQNDVSRFGEEIP